MSGEQDEGVNQNFQQGVYISSFPPEIQAQLQAQLQQQYTPNGEYAEGLPQQQQVVYFVPVANNNQPMNGAVVSSTSNGNMVGQPVPNPMYNPNSYLQPQPDGGSVVVSLEVHDPILERKVRITTEMELLKCCGIFSVTTGIKALCLFEGFVWAIVAVLGFLAGSWTVIIFALLVLPFSISGFKGAQRLQASYLRLYLFYLCLEALVILVLASITGTYVALPFWGVWLCCLLYAAFLVLKLIKAIEKVDQLMSRESVAH